MPSPLRRVQPRSASICLRICASTAAIAVMLTTRRGVEGFVEPRTAVSEVTLLLVAHDGEWTRRRVPSVKWAHEFCNRQQVPSYDAAVVGVPQRMRDYNSRQRKAQKQADYNQYKPRDSRD